MSTIFDRLGYAYIDTAGDIKTLPANTVTSMNNVPDILTAWQINDIASSNVGGYTENPLANTLASIESSRNSIISVYTTATTNTIQGSTSAITTLFNTIKSTAGTLANTVRDFKYHTDRLSDVRSYTDDLAIGLTNMDELPYYTNAAAVGKAISYVILQSDGVSNTSGIMGSFTSLLTKPELSNVATTISTYSSTISGSLTITCDPSNTSICWANSNLSSAVVTSMSDTLTSLNNNMNTRRDHDENFYKKSQIVLGEVRKVKAFTQMGASEDFLARNIIGTDKLKSRI